MRRRGRGLFDGHWGTETEGGASGGLRTPVKTICGLVCCIFFVLVMRAVSVCAAAHPGVGPDLAILEAPELHRDRAAWTILDARTKAQWAAEHLEGARSFSWEDYTRTDGKGVPYRIWAPDELARVLGQMGIDENTPVVVYGDADKSWGGEGWACWVLSWLGHKGPLRILAGGIQAWQKKGYPLTAGPPPPMPVAVHYRVSLRAELHTDFGELEENGTQMAIIDTRSTMEWLTGHIPGAIHIPWDDFYFGEDRRPLDRAALQKLLEEHGVDATRPVAYYCTGGIRSGYAWAVHALNGLGPAKNYEGGMEEWKRRKTR